MSNQLVTILCTIQYYSSVNMDTQAVKHISQSMAWGSSTRDVKGILFPLKKVTLKQWETG